jgi:predicted XRE-type DNA-binding protein
VFELVENLHGDTYRAVYCVRFAQAVCRQHKPITRRIMASKKAVIEKGSGNVFADLGFKDAGERQLKVELAMRLNALLDDQAVNQATIAKLFGVSQPHVSELRNYKLERFSTERLLWFMTLLDHDVEIVIRPKAGQRKVGCLSVLSAA